MTFNPAIAYLGDWRYHDFIENGDYHPPTTGNEKTQSAFGLKVKRDRKQVSRMFGRPLSFNATTEALIVWHPVNSEGKKLPFTPAANGKFVLADGTWVVDDFTKDEFGVYACMVTKAPENVRLA